MDKDLQLNRPDKPISRSWLDDMLLLSSLIMIWGAIVYYAYALNNAGIITTLILTAITYFWTRNFFRHPLAVGRFKLTDDSLGLALGTGFLISIAAAGYLLYNSASDRSLITPWQVINYKFFWLYAFSALILGLTVIRKALPVKIKLTLISVFYGLSFVVAAIIYKIGYGFDPFIHQAAMEIIAEKGLILPKTPYYLGEYSLIVTLSRISGIAVAAFNRWLVPLMAALFIPAALYQSLKKYINSGPAIFLAVIAPLVLTFSPFIATTPQNLSYIFLILAVLSFSSGHHYIRIWILALTAAAIHPLAGLPALALAAYATVNKYRSRLRPAVTKIFEIAIWLFAACSIPTALYFSAGAGKDNIGSFQLLISSLTNLFGHISTYGRENIIANFIYLIAGNFHLFIILLLAASLRLTKQRADRDAKFQTIRRGLILMSSALLCAYFLSSQIIFDNVIHYEQAGYANRLQVAVIVILLPLFTLTMAGIIKKIGLAGRLAIIVWSVFGLGLLSVALYISYPRFDKYFNSRGYSTSANDIAAVKSINDEAGGPYVVLANQQVSAAALKSFGFNHYYQTNQGELYFYPIPTGSPLYQYYLDMVYKEPSPENFNQALDLTGTKNGYLVINKYWYQSGRIINEAKLSADKWWTINNDVYIFKYQRLSR